MKKLLKLDTAPKYSKSMQKWSVFVPNVLLWELTDLLEEKVFDFERTNPPNAANPTNIHLYMRVEIIKRITPKIRSAARANKNRISLYKFEILLINSIQNPAYAYLNRV